MPEFTFEVTAVSTVPPSVLFALEADGSRWSEWARPLVPQSSWEREGVPAPGGVGAVRLLGLRPFFVREETVAYEQDRRHAYAMRTPMPVRDYRAEFVVTPRAGGNTEVTWRGRFVERIPGTGPLFRVMLRSLIRLLARRLIKAAERGRGS